MKSKIIHIINHPLSDEERRDRPRPSSYWDLTDGKWIGFWGDEWADQIANECLKITDEFDHEVWQPDLRADKIYSHTFENGLTHRMFPARESYRRVIISPEMNSYLPKKIFDKKYIFHLGFPHFIGLNKDLIDTYPNSKFVLTFHGEINLPINGLFRFQKNPLKKIHYLRQHFLAKKYFKLTNFITYPSDRNTKTLSQYYHGKLSKLTMGIDCNKFKIINKEECRKKLNLIEKRKILLTVSRLYDLKQVDKIIKVLNNISNDFIFIVVGHGKREYERYLYKKAKELLTKNKIRFEGYRTANELVDYYNAADLFIHVSKSEAGPVSVMEAMACGLPIFCTNVGNTAEVLKTYNKGCVVSIKDYKVWENILRNYLSDLIKIESLPSDVIREHYDWHNVVKKFLEIYRGLSN